MGTTPINQMSDDQLIAEWDAARQHLSLLENEVRKRYVGLRAFKARIAREHGVETGPHPIGDNPSRSRQVRDRAERALAAAEIPSITPKAIREYLPETAATLESVLHGTPPPMRDEFREGDAAIRRLGSR